MCAFYTFLFGHVVVDGWLKKIKHGQPIFMMSIYSNKISSQKVGSIKIFLYMYVCTLLLHTFTVFVQNHMTC